MLSLDAESFPAVRTGCRRLSARPLGKHQLRDKTQVQTPIPISFRLNTYAADTYLLKPGNFKSIGLSTYRLRNRPLKRNDFNYCIFNTYIKLASSTRRMNTDTRGGGSREVRSGPHSVRSAFPQLLTFNFP